MPTYKHDCESCTFLGTLQPREGEYPIDCYICLRQETPNLHSIIGRYGDSGEQYTSSHPPEAFSMAEKYLEMAERWYLFALLTAMRKGLIKQG